MKIIQITDLHILADKEAYLHGVQPYENTRRVIAHIAEQSESPDFVIVTGDITHLANEEAYYYTDELLKTLNIPYYWVAGNHDERATMYKLGKALGVVPEAYYQDEQAQVILLNSNIPNAVPGNLDKSEQDFLKKRLEAAPNIPTIIALHHPVMPVGSAWMDPIALQNPEDFLKIIEPHSQVKAVFCGHIHCETAIQHDSGIVYYSTPSAAFQFNPSSKEFQLDPDKLPGYRLIEINDKGEVHTEVIRVPV